MTDLWDRAEDKPSVRHPQGSKPVEYRQWLGHFQEKEIKEGCQFGMSKRWWVVLWDERNSHKIL